MALDFTVHDVLHKIAAKFVRASLPGAKKPYVLRAANQTELDIHGIAAKAAVFNIHTPPEDIEEGMTAGMMLIFYLLAQGYIIKTPLGTIRLRIPGEYEGHETRLAPGLFPEVTIKISPALRAFIAKNAEVFTNGFLETDGFIAEAVDEATGLKNVAATIGDLLALRGYGLKIKADAAHTDEAGVFFYADDGESAPVKARLALNKPGTLKVIVPAALIPGKDYTLALVTMSSARSRTSLLKETRTLRSDFSLTAQMPVAPGG